MTIPTNIAASNSLADLAARINVEHEAVTKFMKQSLERAIRAGELLIEAKAQLKHGQWLPWLREHCQLPERTASHYMRLAQNASQIGNVADLTVREAIEAIAAKPKKASDFPHWRDWAESFDDLDEWAGATTREPFTDFDFDSERPDWLDHLTGKLATVAGVSSEATAVLSLGRYLDLPTERALTADHIREFLVALAPYVKGEKGAVIEARKPLEAAVCLQMAGQLLVGLMLREVGEREGLSPEQIAVRADSVWQEVEASLDAAKEALERIRRGESIDIDGRRGKTWDDIRDIIAIRAEAASAAASVS